MESGLASHELGEKEALLNLEENSSIPDPLDASDRKSVLTRVNIFIVSTEFWTALGYYGFASSLVLYFQTQLNLSNADADVQFSYWTAVCGLTPLIGGYLADNYFGRTRAIILFTLISAIGLILATASAKPNIDSKGLVFFAMYIIALGIGGTQPNLSTLGADQFDSRYSADRKEMESFFNW